MKCGWERFYPWLQAKRMQFRGVHDQPKELGREEFHLEAESSRPLQHVCFLPNNCHLQAGKSSGVMIWSALCFSWKWEHGTKPSPPSGLSIPTAALYGKETAKAASLTTRTFPWTHNCWTHLHIFPLGWINCRRNPDRAHRCGWRSIVPKCLDHWTQAVDYRDDISCGWLLARFSPG